MDRNRLGERMEEAALRLVMIIPKGELLADARIPWVQGAVVLSITAGACALGSYVSWRLVGRGWNRALAGIIGVVIAACGWFAAMWIGARMR